MPQIGKINEIPTEKRTEFKNRIIKLRERYKMSWERLARLLDTEYGLLISHPTVKRIYLAAKEEKGEPR